MRYKLLGRSGLKISEVALGAMTFGKVAEWATDDRSARAIFDIFVEAGGNTFDVADVYQNGESEKKLGEFVGENRDRYVITSKYTAAPMGLFGGEEANPAPTDAGNSRKNMMASVEGSLKRLGTEYLDLLYLHTWDFLTPNEEVLRAMDDLVRSGKVHYFGLSDTPAWVVAAIDTEARIRGWTRPTALQIEYSLLERTSERELLPAADAHGLTIMSWSPLASGVLSGKYSEAAPGEGDGRRLDAMPMQEVGDRERAIVRKVSDVAADLDAEPEQVALAWVCARGAVPILGATTPEQMRSNLGCIDLTLEDAHLDALDEVSAPSLGFPMQFLAGSAQLTYGGYLDRLDAQLRGVPRGWPQAFQQDG